MDRKKIYTDIYKLNYWNSSESVSGGGSELKTTENIRKELPILFEKFNIKSVLDIPCGDFNWMKEINWQELGIDYMGSDIVEEIIKTNIEKYITENHHLNFSVADIIKDELPKVDLIIVKDCFIHFSLNDIKLSLQNIKRSGSKYVLITNGTDLVKKNDEIETGGGYRGLNFELEPFNFPKPIYEIETLVHDSKLSMWKIEDIRIGEVS